MPMSVQARTHLVPGPCGPVAEKPIVIIVDDDRAMRDAISELMATVEIDSVAFASTTELLDSGLPDRPGCLILDVRMPGMSGLDLQAHLINRGITKPILFLSAFADVPMSVQAMKAGAMDFFTKPFRDQTLIDAVANAIEADRVRRAEAALTGQNLDRYATLTPREREVFRHVVQGRLNKQIAFDLGISIVTVKLHRGSVMRKMGARSVGDLIRASKTLSPSSGPLKS